MSRSYAGIPQRRAPGRTASGALVPLAAGAALAFTINAPATAQQAAAFADFPLVIYCEYSGIASAYYFSQLSGGVAIYLTPDRQAGAITVDGVAHRVGGDRSGSCQDKTLDDLRASKQAFDLPH